MVSEKRKKMKKVKCDFCGKTMFVKPGQPTFCRKCNTDYSAEQIERMLLKTELSGELLGDEPPLDRDSQRRIMINYLEKRKRALDWKQKRRYMLLNFIGCAAFIVGLTALKIDLLGVTPWTIIFTIIMLVLAFLSSSAGYERWLRRFNERPFKHPYDGIFYLNSTNWKYNEAQLNLSADYAFFNKGEYFIRCVHCNKKFPIKKEAAVFVCPDCHKYTEL